MSLNFEENNTASAYRSRVLLGQLEKPKMLTMILKTGVVKTEKSAMTLLILLGVLMFAASIFIFIRSATGPSTVAMPIMYPDGTMSPVPGR